MNKVEMIGHLVSNPELRTSSGSDPISIARFTIAVNRRFKDANGEYGADFPRCVAFGKTAEFIGKYFSKGKLIGIVGRVQTGSYTNKEGNKVYTTEIIVDEAEFVGGKNDTNESDAATTKTEQKPDDAFMDIPDAEEDELPFN